MKSVALERINEFPSQGTIIDMAGNPVNATGWVWRLNNIRASQALNWRSMPILSPEILNATAIYFGRLIRSQAPDSVQNSFKTLKNLSQSISYMDADASGQIIPEKIFAELRSFFGATDYRLHHIRHWYRDCVDIGCPAFSAEVAFALEEKTIGGNKKGQAVLSLDPEDGPLSDLEIMALLNALRSSAMANSMPLQEKVALWLCIALGANPVQYTLLREDDVELIQEDGQSFVQIKMPRMKKGFDSPRSEFRTRKLTLDIGSMLISLIEENRCKQASLEVQTEVIGRPIFVRQSIRTGALDGPLAEYAWHLYSTEFTNLVSLAVMRLGVISPRTGRALHVTTRRLRYTFATRLVREGASMRDLAEALDHTDLQNVRVYFDIKSDIVESLDKAMALALGPVAQAFLGKLVGSEEAAARGDDPRSRIMVQDRASGKAEGLGTCGQHSFCSLFAPVACYTCHQFQPWMDGPHDKILETLLSERERRAAAGQDGRMVSLHDATILAIGDVISRIETISGRAVT